MSHFTQLCFHFLAELKENLVKSERYKNCKSGDFKKDLATFVIVQQSILCNKGEPSLCFRDQHESLFGLIKFHLNAPLGLGSESTQVFKEIHCISQGDLTKKGLRLVSIEISIHLLGRQVEKSFAKLCSVRLSTCLHYLEKLVILQNNYQVGIFLSQKAQFFKP